MFAKNYINHNPQTVTNPFTCLLMTPSGQKSKLLYTSYLEKCIAFYLSRFTDRTPYTAMPPAFCVLFFMGSGYWVVRHCYSVQWYLFINNMRAGPYLLFRMLASMSPFPFSTTTFLSSFKRSYRSGTQITNVGTSITPYLLLLY